jgi:hypothetical protein
MKTKLLFTFFVRRSFSVGVFFFLLSFIFTYSQAPLGFNYQAVVRDAQGDVISEQVVSLKISLLKGSESGSPVYIETHQKTTNTFGLITLEIGNGTMIFGNILAIDWSVNSYFMKIEMDAAGGTDYQPMGTSQLLSVPYALNASSVTSLKSLSIMEPIDHVAESALFEVKNKDGNIVFAVYNEGVRVYVNDDAAKGLKGGFAVGGFSSSKDVTNEYFRVTPDSVRVYVDTVNSKGLKGGFAVGGYSSSKGLANEYLRVTPDSVRIYINESMAKGRKGGFAVGGFSSSKGTTTDFMHLTPDNYFIGHESGSSITTGLYNSFMGYKAGVSTTTGNSNVFIGHESGLENLNGNWNVFVGNNTGQNNTTGFSNIIIGDGSGEFNTEGYGNVIMGDWAGRYNTTGNQNVFIGAESGHLNDTGSYNVFIGTSAGGSNDNGSYNVFMGSGSGSSNITGNYNVFLGEGSGYTNSIANSNVFIGLEAGYFTTTGSYNVALGTLSGNSNTTGEGNVYLGQEAGHDNLIGSYYNVAIGSLSGFSNTDSNNVYIGFGAGYNNVSGKNNIFIGYEAGMNETGSNKLYIDNSGALTNDALIYGDFSSGYLSFNADVDITWDLDVGGDVTATGFIEPSDIRWKTNIAAYENALDKLMQISGVNFEWKNKESGHWKFPDGNQLGVIAQEVEKVIPELVKTNGEGYKLVDYTKLSVVLIEAVKEQQMMIEELQKENRRLQNIEQRLNKLEKKLK